MKSDQEQLRKDYWLWCLAFAAAVCWPLFLFTYPSAQDIPNHLARAFILLNADDAALGAHFVVGWHPTPNLAWDVFAVTVGKLLPLSWTLKLFMMMSYALTMIGVFLLNRVAAGRWTWMPLAAAPFLFHLGVSKGFLSFNFGVGLSLIACAWWSANTERNWVRRLVVASLLSLLLFYAHFAAWGIYGVFVLGSEIANLVRLYRDSGPRTLGPWLLRLGRDGTQGVLPLAVSAFITRFADVGTKHVGEIRGIDWPYERIWEALHIIDTGGRMPSVLFLGVIGSFLLYLARRRSIVFSKRYVVAIALLVALFFATPNVIRSTMYIVWRIALGSTLIAIASGIPTEAINARSSRFRLAFVLAVVVGLSGWQALSTYHSEAARRDYTTLIGGLPEGSSLFMVHSELTQSEIEFDRLGTYHMGAYAVIERKIMVQNMFANPAQQTISYHRPALNNGGVFLDGQRDELLSQFDWIVIHGPDRESEGPYLPEEDYRFIREVGQFRLYCNEHPVPNPFLSGGINVCPGGR